MKLGDLGSVFKIETGCTERNVWGKLETGKRLCRDCGATYESHCICHAVKKKLFVVIGGK